jgi:hypothetical protein
MGISAHACDRGSLLAQVPGTVCAKCYAKRGHYTCGGVNRCHDRRLEGLGHPQWVDAMAFMLEIYDERWFRWFDSGDLQSLEHLENIVEVCKRTPSCRHWLPTHETYIVGEFLETREFPSNLTVRISADYIESKPTAPTWGLPVSTVHKYRGEPVPGSTECKSWTRENRCGPCRACWNPKVDAVSYHTH